MKYSVSLNELDAFAKTFWKEAGNARVFLFHGEMGAGKTTLIAALCRALGVTDAVSSPTFSIINEYAYGNGQPVFHMDLYRLNSPEEAVQTGVEECLVSGDICLVEWPGKAPGLFDEAAVPVYISALDGYKRLIEIPHL